jgi:DNA-binding transcriptional LysR family regulator
MYNHAVLDWDDLRYFLAVARTGSTLAAARSLRISQPTVVRRVAALESALGVTLFERRTTGYVLTSAGKALLGKSEAVEQSVVAVEEAALGQLRATSGTVTISAYEIYAVTLLAPILSDLHRTHPDMRIDLDVSDAVRDLASGEADIALRSSVELSGASLVCRRIADERWALYCSRGYADANGAPRSPEELEGHPVIGEGGEDFWPDYERWRRDAQIRNAVELHHGSATALLSAARSGFGIALLPCIVADRDQDLVRCFAGPNTGHSLWLIAHERVRRTPRVRLVMDLLAKRLKAVAQEAAS